MTRYEVVVQPSAEAEIESAYLYLRTEASEHRADKWLDAIEGAVVTLERMPKRCPIAPESSFFEEEIRQLIVPPYRILFTIEQRTVYVLHVRHTSRRALDPDE